MTINILSVSESDVKGLRGIQADAKTTAALGGNLFSVPTFHIIDCDDTKCNVTTLSEEAIQNQIHKIISENDISAIKIGSLFNEDILDAVFSSISNYKNIPVVTDTNFVTRYGKIIFDENIIGAFKRKILLVSNVLVINLKEAELLTGMKINDIDDMSYATALLRTMGVENVVLKAGQAISNKIVYFVAGEDKELLFKRDRIDGKGTIGSGSLFSSNIAINLAKGIDVFAAVEDAINILHTAISTSKYDEQETGWLNLDFISEAENNTIIEEVEFKKKAIE